MATSSNCLIRAAEPSEQMGSWYWSWSLTKQIDGQGGSFLFQEWYINVCTQKQFPKQDPPIHPQTSDRWPHVLLPYYLSESHLSASTCRRHWQLRRFVYNWCGGRMLQVDHNRTPDALLPMATPKRARCRAAHCTVKDILKGNPPCQSLWNDRENFALWHCRSSVSRICRKNNLLHLIHGHGLPGTHNLARLVNFVSAASLSFFCCWSL